MSKSNDILLVGSGNMGLALVRGWVANGQDPKRIQVVDPSADARDAAAGIGVAAVADVADATLPAEVVLFAVKPQQLEKVLPAYCGLKDANTVFLSIAAGKRLEFFEQALGRDASVVRAMPNTPAAIGQGMTVLVANAAATDEQRELCESLMCAVGEVAWIDNEDLMDAVTAVSGSGPAYVFLLIECLADAAVSVGIDRQLARRLAETTVAGAGAYAIATAEDARELRRRVTSPGGTTEAALDLLISEDALPALLRRAVLAATARGRELA
ncbi:MAG TPA: pyrroline-5-carboxylate reductase [Gammaproteobacteria bacterium]